MAQANISIGTNPNDGTGTPLRTAMGYIQNNFTEFYSVITPTPLAGNNASFANNITVAANVNSNNLFANTKLQVGSSSGYNFGSLAVIEIDANQNTYVQSVIQNANSGTQASGDLVITADTGNDSFGYIDLGINSSTYSNASYNIGGALDGYLYSSNSNLLIGTASAKEVVFHANGTLSTNRIFTINATAVTIANGAALVANGSTGTAGYYLTSNGTGVYWSSEAFLGANQDAQYTWSNTQTFQNTITFSSILNANTINATNTFNTASGSGGTTSGITITNTNISIGNSSVNTSTNSTHFFSGNSTVYGLGNNTSDVLVNPTGNLSLTAVSINLVNASANVLVANLSGLYVNAAVNATSHTSGTNAVFNSTNLLYTGNTTLQPTITLSNTGAFSIGNSSTTQTTSIISIANSAGNVVITPVSVSVDGADTINATGIYTTGTVNASSYTAGSNAVFNSTNLLYTGNTTLQPTVTLSNTGAFSIGNSSTTQTTSIISIANSAGNVVITPVSVSVDGADTINATGIYTTGTVNATSHTSGTNAVFNSTNLLYTGNTTLQPTITLSNTGAFSIGNSSTTQTTSIITVANSVGNIAITPISITLANTTQPFFVANSTAATAYNKVQIGNNALNPYSYGTAAAIEIDLTSNGFVQVVIQNANSQLNASSDLVAAADSGNDVSNYVDLGINSSTYSNASYNIGGALDAYLYASNGALTIGTASVKDVVIHAGGTTTTNRILTVNTSGVTVNTSSNLTVLSNTFNLGTSNVSGHTTYGAGGYTYLPNGLKMIFGAITTANSTANVISFSAQSGVSFTSNCYSLTLTSNAVASVAAAYTVNATSFTLITNSATSSTVSFMAIGI